ncbi:MAG TPA: hypothetical protein VGK67_29230 [Myxococcales bacterium]|jgi:hypothetical protein
MPPASSPPSPRDRPAPASRLYQIFAVLSENPFRLLGLSPPASARDVEREGARLLAVVSAGLDDPRQMAPLGPAERSAEQVRWAIAELRDPHRRAVHEFFWPACQSLPIDLKRLGELLDRLSAPLPGDATLAQVLQDLAGEIVPVPPPYRIPPELAARLEELLSPAPRLARAPDLCPDSLDLPGLFPLPAVQDPPTELGVKKGPK